VIKITFGVDNRDTLEMFRSPTRFVRSKWEGHFLAVTGPWGNNQGRLERQIALDAAADMRAVPASVARR